MRSIYILFFITLSASAFGKALTEDNNLFNKRREDIQGKTAEKIHLENKQHIQDFIEFDVDTPQDNNKFRAQFISRNNSLEVLNRLRRNPIASQLSISKYDPKGNIGFCFGRAMFVNLELAYRRFDRDSIKKAFVIGPMSTGEGTLWSWHVATIVQSLDQNNNEIWLVIDPVTGLTTLKNWYNFIYNNYSLDQKLKLYITHAGKFGMSKGFYDHDDIESSFYNDYFNDLMNWFGTQYENGEYENLVLKEYRPDGVQKSDFDIFELQKNPVLGL